MTTRATIDLNGAWEFQIDPHGTVTPTTLAPDRQITVPGCWQAQFPDLLRYAGIAWYQRQVAVPADWAGGRLRLHFGAVDYTCQVYVNGQLAGSHEGGYLPFHLEVSHLIVPGSLTTIAVRVADAAHHQIVLGRWGNEFGPDTAVDIDPDEIPHGKQSWYCEVSGLWQDVRLERWPALAIEQVATQPDITGPSLVARVTLTGSSEAATVHLTARREDDDTGPAYTAEAALAAGTTEATLRLPMPGARLWSPEAPTLYRLTARLEDAGRVLDEVTLTTGLREIAVRDGHLLLNGQPLYLRGALDQDFYPDTVYTPPSEALLRDQFLQAKALGLNCLRLHIKPADPRYLDWADRLGLLIWEEVPSWRTLWPKERRERRQDLPPAVRARVRDHLLGMIARDINHPSVIAYSIVNEDWGTQLVTSAADRAWLAELYAEAKAADPSRLVCDNSPCNSDRGPNFHVRTDLDDFHIYFGIPDNLHRFEDFVAAFAQRPSWTFSPFGDAQRSGDEPLILSEFGNWGLPEPTALAAHWPAGRPPWWFESHAWWNVRGNEISHPGGLAERFQQWGLDEIWPDVDAFARATQWHEFEALAAEIAALRRQPRIRGYVVTEFTDCYWEANGLLDFYRQPKVFHAQAASILGPTVLLPGLPHRACWSGEHLRLPVAAAHDGPSDLAAGTLGWRLGEVKPAGQTATPSITAGTLTDLGTLEVTLPAVATPAQLPLELSLTPAGQAAVTRRRLDLTIIPAAEQHARQPVRLFVAPETEPAVAPPVQSQATTAALLADLGYPRVATVSDSELILATVMTPELSEHVRAGRTVIYIPAPEATSPFLAVLPRHAPWDGNWITAYHFIRPGWCGGRLPAATPVGLAYRQIIPRAVISGFRAEEHADMLAGLVAGWCERPAATIAQLRLGAGRVIMCTWPLLAHAGRDPLATLMLHELIAYAASPRCAPRKRLP